MSETYEVEIDLRAMPEIVWSALTERHQLVRWFCEHADIDLDSGRFDFWGRHTPGAPTHDEGHGRIVAMERLRRLSIEWGGVTITFTLGDGTLNVLHEGVADRPSSAEHLPSHWWQFALGHLDALLTTGATGPRFDWSWPHHAGFSATAEIDAPPETIFDELVDGWVRPDNPRRRPARNEHEDFGFDVGVVVGVKVLDLERPSRFALEWIQDEVAVLSYDIVPGPNGGTHITIVQSGFAPGMDLQGQAEGFFSGVLELAWRLAGHTPTIRRLQDGSHDMRLASERT
jgi:uncharacterized protein YndB with AHSA1/START domain